VTDALIKQRRREIPAFKQGDLETVRDVLDWSGDGRLDILEMEPDEGSTGGISTARMG
jgi:hypothetical protein